MNEETTSNTEENVTQSSHSISNGMKISVVLGTARVGRRSENVARSVYDACSEHGALEPVYVDIREHLETFATTRYGKEDMTEHAWKDIAGESEGFIFVLPEYNHGYPGEWKLLMDSLYKSEYMDKVAGLTGVSSGNFGGVRALEQASLSLVTRGMYVMKDTLSFPRVAELYDEDGKLQSEDQATRITDFVDLFAETLQKKCRI